MIRDLLTLIALMLAFTALASTHLTDETHIPGGDTMQAESNSSEKSTMIESILRQDGIIYHLYLSPKEENYANNYATVEGNYLSREQEVVIIPEYVSNEGIDYPVTEICSAAFYNGDEKNPGNYSLKTVKLPETVHTIGRSAFRWCYGLTTIDLPSSLKTIEAGAFFECGHLYYITIPESVTAIGSRAFYGCYCLPFMSLGQIPKIEDQTFYECDNLRSVTIPNTVTSIGEEAFYACKRLSSVSIQLPSDLTSIGRAAFWSSGLESITLPETITDIGVAAFAYTDLKSIKIPSSLTTINMNAFICCDFTTLEIPNTITEIGESAFSGCAQLTSLEIANSVTEIGRDAFAGCRSLTSLSIPNSLDHIRTGTFIGCTELTSVDIPNSIKWFGSEVFKRCNKLRTINYKTSTPAKGSKDMFDETVYLRCSLNVAEGGLENAYEATPWGLFLNIFEKDFSGVDEVMAELDPEKPLYIFTIKGERVDATIDSLPDGIYIIRQGSLSKKIAVNRR